VTAITDGLGVDATTLDELSASFSGELVRPGDPAYHERRRVWNGSIDRAPALIVRCAAVADVKAALILARSTGLPLAVRGGGHSLPGHSVCDGIVLDLGPMKGIRVDPAARMVQAQAAPRSSPTTRACT
jgi:FAD/FMN-containing dehydrogenase